VKTHVLIHPRAEELLVERALRPLTPEEEQELADLGVDRDETVDLAAAALAVATARVDETEMPVDLMDRLMASLPGEATQVDFRRTLAGVTMPASGLGPRTSDPGQSQSTAPVVSIEAARAKKRRTISPAWFVAAASVALAIGAFVWANRGKNDSGEVAELSAAAERDQLMASAADAKPLAWTVTEDKAARGASGDVVWSRTEQRGFMRFVGLAANNPREWQYQLWIFDGTRDQAFPVDGGVFDVGANGEVVVPISAKLHVTDATLFAVTVEKPGGVVVSRRERIVVTAKPS
jgi:Zn-dependent protease with chaperone function